MVESSEESAVGGEVAVVLSADLTAPSLSMNKSNMRT